MTLTIDTDENPQIPAFARKYGVRGVAEHGHKFIGIERPKGHGHQMALKMCFRNAARLAMDGRGTYVEGYALVPGGLPFDHAWITLDGLHAVDQTLTNASAYDYFGIEIATPDLRKILHRQQYWGVFSVLDPDLKENLRLLGLAK